MGKPSQPDPPDYAAANEAAIFADIETLATRKKIESAAKLGTKVTYTDPKSGEERTVDFTGFGDVEQTRGAVDFLTESADALTKAQLESQKKYGEEFIKQREKERRAADPLGAQVRERLGEQALQDVEAGYELPPGLLKQVQQSERAAQAARGNIFGQAPAAAEAMAVGDAAFRMRQQRLANAASFLQGVTPVAQFGQIAGAQAGASPFQPVGIQQGVGLNPNAGAQGAQFAQNTYGTQAGIYGQQMANNPWNILAKTAGQTVGKAAGGFAGGLFT